MTTPFSITPLEALGDAELGQISEYRRYVPRVRREPSPAPAGEVEALEQVLDDIEAEIWRRGRLLLMVEADDEVAALDDPLVAEWLRWGWKVKTLLAFRMYRRQHVFLRLVALDSPGA